MKKAWLSALLFIAWGGAGLASAAGSERPGGAVVRDEETLAFAFCVWDESQIKEGLVLAESIRAFGGRFSRAPVLALILKDLAASSAGSVGDFIKLDVEVRTFEAPPEAAGFPLAEKIFAASEAEAGLEAKASLLAWMDPDTVVWREPGAFLLDDGKSLGYRPVMHQLIGSSFEAPADAFWSRLYEVLGVGAELLFPMTTPVDGKTIRPYFNAGLLIVRPGAGVLRAWAKAFLEAAADGELLEMCRADSRKLVFLHQAALAGAVLTTLPGAAMIELPETYNYPLNLHETVPAERRRADLDGLVTLRYDEGARVPGLISASGLRGKLADWLLSRF